MIIYNNIWLANLLIREEAQKARKAEAISIDEQKKIADKYPVGFYTPNIFIRIGLFILTCIIVSFSVGLLVMMTSNLDIIDTWGFSLFIGIITYIVLEVMIKSNNHFKSGVDDALIWISAGFILTAFILLQPTINNDFPYSRVSLFIFLLAFYYALRFTDMLMTAVSLIALIATVFMVWKDLILWGMLTMPFLIMIVCSGIYFLSRRSVGKKTTIYYNNCFLVIQIISLLILYLAGNYYVVQVLSPVSSDIAKPTPVPFGFFFWTWTILLPLVYIYSGLRKKDAIVLRTGLLLVAAAAFTFRNYYHVMPIEGVLCIAGIILLGICYWVMKYLKTPKHGFTYEDLEQDNFMDKLKVESLIVSETFSGPQVPADNTRFGGGDFGGGGASGNF
ncbi:hypothetical protein CPT03_18855 [Pedobacter ginsengisoli]|uniref:DUF2157 domain-containing protein n=1 Tax=Pedobacter ginsengisoli TaxID=363852 RepID=A0A2D1UA45_9SPHI|nr:hypothetical protein [Pedobacter ginsengisoli]ATP58374.1 hypothetical protein CPT03_18855 [Pedobacter ginsengisoli]